MTRCDGCETPVSFPDETKTDPKTGQQYCVACCCQSCGSPRMTQKHLFADWLKCLVCGALHFQNDKYQPILVEEEA